ncbi:hypothetical protein CPB86DRAFT_828077 [Serendipita vermifera]|nr:hypothetical protein CPB86DRAFT_828077 [Serendipita vermifera]
MSAPESKAGNCLSIDGGVNPLSALYIIDEMLQCLQFDIGSEEDIRACDWFDLIVGSGHGGLIALLLGRLRMTVSQASYKRVGDKDTHLPRIGFRIRSEYYSGKPLIGRTGAQRQTNNGASSSGSEAEHAVSLRL